MTAKACRDELRHFDVDMQKFPDVVSFVANIIKASPTVCGVTTTPVASPDFGAADS